MVFINGIRQRRYSLNHFALFPKTIAAADGSRVVVWLEWYETWPATDGSGSWAMYKIKGLATIGADRKGGGL